MLNWWQKRLWSFERQRHVLVKKYQQNLQKFLRSQHRLTFVEADRPELSILIPVFNSACHTLRCLQSLQRQHIRFEIIIFDNASHDETTELLSRCDHIKVIRSDTNLGFIGAINSAAKAAKGQYLLLLNNDAIIAEGDLGQAIAIFETESNVGAVGARIKFATGKAQEAGSLIFKNGATDGFLRNRDVNNPLGLYRRDVDYCSGVFLLLERQQFERMQGLDEAFAPAYYEETDLCMRLRKVGLRVVYTPAILIEHFEFGSQASERAQQMIAERKPIFLARWLQTLQAENYLPATTPHAIASRRLIGAPRALLVADDPKAAEVTAITKCARDNGWHITLLSKVEKNWFNHRYGLDERVEVIPQTNSSQLRHILAERRSFYQLVICAGPKAASLRPKTSPLPPAEHPPAWVLATPDLGAVIKALERLSK